MPVVRVGIRLLKLVTEQQVGIVLGLEMSRLARNSKDWSDMFEVSAIFRTLIADEDGLFDPNEPNDRLVLGLKGIISEMELHTMKIRLERGRLNKAQRSELFHDVPAGFVKGDDVAAKWFIRQSLGRKRTTSHHDRDHASFEFNLRIGAGRFRRRETA